MRRSARTVLAFLTLLCLYLLTASVYSQTPDGTKRPVLEISGDTTVLARLHSDLYLGQSKVGDEVQAETSQDVKKGKEVLLKKGSVVIGHVSFVEPASDKQPSNMVGILFDEVRPKNGSEHSLPVIIRALAPQPEPPGNATISGGRGMPGETDKAVVSGREHGDTGGVESLNASSVGVSNIPGLEIGMRKSVNGQHTSVLTWSKGDIKLKKGYQLVLLVVGQ